MDWQWPVVFAALGLALAYCVRAGWRLWAGKGSCTSGCGRCVPSHGDKPEHGTGRIALPRV